MYIAKHGQLSFFKGRILVWFSCGAASAGLVISGECGSPGTYRY